MNEVRDRPVLSKAELRRALCGSDDLDSFLRFIDHGVERGNHLAHVLGRSDFDNYVNGDINLAFEYEISLKERKGLDSPDEVPMILAAPDFTVEPGEVRYLASDHVTGDAFVFTYWGRKPMAVPGSEIMDGIEKLVPSMFSVRLQLQDCLVECVRNPMGQSVLHGFVKPCFGFAERELDIVLSPARTYEGRDDFPVSVVEGSSKPLNGTIGNVGHFTYYGYVAFSKDGALTGLLIRFDDVSEGALFAENFGKLVDVFRSPINLN